MLNTHDGRVGELRRKASRAPMLDAQAEQQLARAVRQGSQQALAALVASHMRLVFSVAESYARPGVAIEDLVSEGSVGLLEAARRFDPERGTRFGTYAAWWVRAYVRRYAMANRRIVGAPSTRHARRILWSLRRIERELAQRTGQAPSRQEVADALEVDPEEVAAVEAALGGRDVALGGDEEGVTVELPGDGPTPEDTVAENEARALDADRVREALRSLSAREREIVRRRLLEDDETTLSALGALLGVSRERVRQIQQRAQSKLRSCLEASVA